ncbi:MAG TPA: organomercurial lyase [Phycisphaerae bacterium]|nr:organomercurial lyase [Phycisphaerae bacterium]
MSKIWKIAIVVALVAAVVIVIIHKHMGSLPGTDAEKGAAQVSPPAAGLPRLVDLGSTTCIPCKMMAPILEGLKKEYEGRLQVEFIDVMANPDAAGPYKISLIPTQVFFDASGKERFRHEGFFSKEDILAKWKELGVDLSAGAPAATGPTFSRMEPAKADDRPKDTVCYLCDGDIDLKTLVVVKSAKGDVRLCGPHCYVIMYSCLTEDKTDFEKKVSVTDWADGQMVPLAEAVYLYGADEKTGRPTIKAFAARDAAEKERLAAGGNLLAWNVLQEKELAARCGFCDRAVYPQDAAAVKVDGASTWGCCSHCALGVAARTGKDIEVHQPDRLTGEMIVVKTASGRVASLEPKTAVAWFGQRKAPDGKFVSAGCFHQGFFVNEENLVKWVEQNPTASGKAIAIAQALADKMKLSPQQIQKACKIGECAPK